MIEAKYKIVDHNEQSVNDDEWSEDFKARPRQSHHYTWLVATLLLISGLGNAFLIYELSQQSSISPLSPSKYAGLVNDLDVPFRSDTEFTTGNYTEVNKLWYDDEESDKGVIALDYDYAESLGLRRSQPFPWDTRKGIYIINGYHNLHCLRNIYISLDQFRNNQPQMLTWHHVLHCLGALRADIICNADDTPRFTDPETKPGEGQERKCRDWNQLRNYAEEHTGCFKYIHPENHTFGNIERMKFCPNDSPYLAKIREYFGLPNDWLPWPVEGIS